MQVIHKFNIKKCKSSINLLLKVQVIDKFALKILVLGKCTKKMQVIDKFTVEAVIYP